MAKAIGHEYIEDALRFVFPGDCLDEMLIKFNVFHPQCSQLVLSRVLGLGITIGSILLFVPQIIKISTAKSAQGISLTSQLLAFFGAFGTAAYSYKKGFVFSQWGDALFVTIQLAIIVMQILYYNGAGAHAAAFLALCWALTSAVMGGYIPLNALATAQGLSIFIVAASKILQAYENYSSKSTGQLSFISVSLQLAGTVARVFTTYQEAGDDKLLLISFGSAAAFNAVIFAQFITYWNSQKKGKVE